MTTLKARHLLRVVLSGIAAFAEAVKETLVETKPNSTLLLNMVAKGCWLIPLLLCPNIFEKFPDFYHSFQQQGPKWFWVSIIGLLIVIDAVAIRLRAFKFQVGPLILSTFFWPFLATVISAGSARGILNCPGSPWFFMCWALAGSTLIGLLLRVMKYNGDTEAHELDATRRSPLICDLIARNDNNLRTMAANGAVGLPEAVSKA